MSEIEEFVDQLRRIQEKDPWHGPALLETLAGVSADMAAMHPVAGLRSIWELVLHIIGWEEVFTSRLEGHPINEPEEGDFPAVTGSSAEDWGKALNRLTVGHKRLIDKVSRLSDSDLNRTVVGKDYTVRFMLSGTICHHVYHAGQIGLLKKAIQFASSN